MRIITSYACTLDVETAEEAAWRFNLYRGVMDDWLRDQGIGDPRKDSPSDTFIQLKRRDVAHDGAQVDSFLLKQPILESSHILHTSFDLAANDQSLALFLQFSVERLTSRIAPVSIQVGCPRALATILESGDWRSGQVRVRPHCRRVFGTDAGQQIRDDITDRSRTTPIVLLANFRQWDKIEPYDDAIWGDFVNRLEDDLGGVAQLVELDELAADALVPPNEPPARRSRPVLGLSFVRQYREWGMCGSVVRIVWPLDRDEFVPDQHPAWGPWENFYEVDDEDRYDYPIHYGGSGNVPDPWITLFRGHELMGVRPSIRDTIYEQAALQPIPELIDDIRRRYIAAERKRLAASTNFDEWQQLYDAEIEQKDREIALQGEEVERLLDAMEEEIERREHETTSQREEIERLQEARDKQDATINQLQFQLGQARGEADADEHAEGAIASPEPTTVSEALQVAQEQCQRLAFGKDVWDSAGKIDSEPALARKVLSALQVLNEGTELAAKGDLGTSLSDWTHSRLGLDSSPEHKPRNFKDDQGKAQEFSMHLKLKEATAANKAVRIYYDHLSHQGKTLVGYIGPHL